MRAYITDRSRVLGAQTAERYARSLDVFGRWLAETYPRGSVYPDVLTKRLLVDYYGSLTGNGRHGRPRMESTRQKLVGVVQLMWAWAANDDDWGDMVGNPKRLEMRKVAGRPTLAPTWAEADLCVAACSGWRQRLAIVLRYTGLRVQQAMGLRWDDLDLGAATLRMRGELGKTRAERRGRIIPVSPHLAAEMATWGVRDGWVVEATEGARGRWLTMGNARVREAWEASGVRPEVWRGRPHHAFRKAFVSGLIGAGAQREAVEYLVGHSLGLAGVYTDPEALGLREAVGMVPAVGGGSVVDIRSRGAK